MEVIIEHFLLLGYSRDAKTHDIRIIMTKDASTNEIKNILDYLLPFEELNVTDKMN